MSYNPNQPRGKGGKWVKIAQAAPASTTAPARPGPRAPGKRPTPATSAPTAPGKRGPGPRARKGAHPADEAPPSADASDPGSAVRLTHRQHAVNLIRAANRGATAAAKLTLQALAKAHFYAASAVHAHQLGQRPEMERRRSIATSALKLARSGATNEHLTAFRAAFDDAHATLRALAAAHHGAPHRAYTHLIGHPAPHPLTETAMKDLLTARLTIRRYAGHYDPNQARDATGKWTSHGHTGKALEAASAREAAKKGGKKAEAGRHHALQLAHEAAAAIKGGGDHKPKVAELEKAVTALRIQHYHSTQKGAPQAEQDEKKAVHTHFHGILKSLKAGEVPEIHAHGAQPDAAPAPAAEKVHILKPAMTMGKNQPELAQTADGKAAVEIAQAAGAHTDHGGFDSSHPVGTAMRSTARLAERLPALHAAIQGGDPEAINKAWNDTLEMGGSRKVNAAQYPEAAAHVQKVEAEYEGLRKAGLEKLGLDDEGNPKPAAPAPAAPAAAPAPAAYDGKVPGLPTHKELWDQHQRQAAESDWMNVHHENANKHIQAALEHTARGEFTNARTSLDAARISLDASRRTSDFDEDGEHEGEARGHHASASKMVDKIEGHVTHATGADRFGTPVKRDLTSAGSGASDTAMSHPAALHASHHALLTARNEARQRATASFVASHDILNSAGNEEHHRAQYHVHDALALALTSAASGNVESAHKWINAARNMHEKITPTHEVQELGKQIGATEQLINEHASADLPKIGANIDAARNGYWKDDQLYLNTNTYSALGRASQALSTFGNDNKQNQARWVNRSIRDALEDLDKGANESTHAEASALIQPVKDYLYQHNVPQPNAQPGTRPLSYMKDTIDDLRDHEKILGRGGVTPVTHAADAYEHLIKAAGAFGTDAFHAHLDQSETHADAAHPAHQGVLKQGIRQLRDAHAALKSEEFDSSSSERLEPHFRTLMHVEGAGTFGGGDKTEALRNAVHSISKAHSAPSKTEARTAIRYAKYRLEEAGPAGDALKKELGQWDAHLGEPDAAHVATSNSLHAARTGIDKVSNKEQYKALTAAQKATHDHITDAARSASNAFLHLAEGQPQHAAPHIAKAREAMQSVKPAMLAKLPEPVQAVYAKVRGHLDTLS